MFLFLFFKIFIVLSVNMTSGQKKKKRYSNVTRFFLSGRQDSNLRPPGPKPGALPACATSRTFSGRNLKIAGCKSKDLHLKKSKSLRYIFNPIQAVCGKPLRIRVLP